MNNDLISREALRKDIEHLYSVYVENKDYFYTDVLDHIDNAPTVELVNDSQRLVKELVKGEWECVRVGNINYITCSHCKEQFETENTLELWQAEYKFCHRCGAKMKGGAENE